VGWTKIPDFVPSEDEFIHVDLSVVVACRNEEVHLPRLLKSLAEQSYKNFELILINDHSTDKTAELLAEVSGFLNPVTCIQASKTGKKNALCEGILHAKGDLIVTTDADCIPCTTWLETILRFQTHSPSDLIICPVKMTDSSSVFTRLQSLEFTALIASGAGASGAGMPILCNGANLAFSKVAWLKSRADLHVEEQSGDDIFLLQSIKKRGGVIRFLKSESAFVTTESSGTLTEFYNQRRRWASKTPSYTDWHTIVTACVVFSISLLPFFLLIMATFGIPCWYILLFVFGFKYLLDTFFLASVRSFFQLRSFWTTALLLSFIYPFYVVFVGISALLFKPLKWN